MAKKHRIKRSALWAGVVTGLGASALAPQGYSPTRTYAEVHVGRHGDLVKVGSDIRRSMKRYNEIRAREKA